MGKNSQINQEFKKLGSLSEEDKKIKASSLNNEKQKITFLDAPKQFLFPKRRKSKDFGWILGASWEDSGRLKQGTVAEHARTRTGYWIFKPIP